MASRLPSGHAAGSSEGEDTFADALDLVAETASAAAGPDTEFGPLQPTPDTRDILSLHSDADARLKRQAPDGIALSATTPGRSCCPCPSGAGVWSPSPTREFASNANLARSENAAFLANVLARDARRRGDRAVRRVPSWRRGAVRRTAASGPRWAGRLQLALIQAALALAVLVGVARRPLRHARSRWGAG